MQFFKIYLTLFILTLFAQYLNYQCGGHLNSRLVPSGNKVFFFKQGSGLGADFIYGNYNFQVRYPRYVEYKLKYNIKYK